MSAPLNMTPLEVGSLATFLHGLTRLTRQTGVNVCAYGRVPLEVSPAGSVLSARWDRTGDDGRGEYVIEDRAGE